MRARLLSLPNRGKSDRAPRHPSTRVSRASYCHAGRGNVLSQVLFRRAA